MYELSSRYSEGWFIAMGLPLGCLRKKKKPSCSGLELPDFDSGWSERDSLGPFLLHIRLFLSFLCVASSSQFFPAQALPERLRPRLGPHGQRGICLQPADRLSLRLITTQFSREPVLPAVCTFLYECACHASAFTQAAPLGNRAAVCKGGLGCQGGLVPLLSPASSFLSSIPTPNPRLRPQG